MERATNGAEATDKGGAETDVVCADVNAQLAAGELLSVGPGGGKWQPGPAASAVRIGRFSGGNSGCGGEGTVGSGTGRGGYGIPKLKMVSYKVNPD